VQAVIDLLREIGQRYSKTPSQVALRWLIEKPLVVRSRRKETPGKPKKM